MADAFEKLAEELSADQKLEYFSTLREIGITTKSDMTLAKLLQALQLYKAYYESIPAAVDKAATNMAQIKTEIVKLARQTEQSANAGEASLHQLMNGAAEMNGLLKRIHSHIEEAADKASEIVSNRMTELLTGAMEKALPLSDLKEAGTTFFDAIKNSEYASAELRDNVKYVRRARFRTLAVAFVLSECHEITIAICLENQYTCHHGSIRRHPSSLHFACTYA